MIKAIIFDLDGLLIDSEIISFEIYREILEEYGIAYALDEYAKKYSGKTEIANLTRLIETYNLPMSMETGFELVHTIETKKVQQGIALKNGAKELLVYLNKQGYRLAVATSSKKERAMNILKQHKIEKNFECFVFAEDISKSKPEPEVFLKACEKLGAKPEECLVLEDSEAGIMAAHRAGISVICIPDMKKPSRQYLDMTEAVFSSLIEVISYLQE